MRLPKAISEFRSISLEKPFAQRAVVEAKPIAAFEQLSHAP
jgi:hypothetical protein